MTTAPDSSKPSAASVGVDAVRFVASVAPVVAAATPPARGFLSAFGLLVRLYTDPRYRPSALGRIGPIAVLGIAILNYAFWNYLLALPVVAPLAERVILIVLAGATYAMLSREVVRYRAVLEYLAKYG